MGIFGCKMMGEGGGGEVVDVDERGGIVILVKN